MIGTKAYYKLNGIITDTRLINDVKNLSSEELHSTLNHWHPKMLSFSWLGTYCRLVI